MVRRSQFGAEVLQLGLDGVGIGQRSLGALREEQGEQAIGEGAEGRAGQGIGGHGVGVRQLFGKGMGKYGG